MDNRPKNKSFTLIELIVTIAIMAIIMIPIALMTLQFIKSAAYANALTIASDLGQQEMAVVSGLNYDDATLAGGYDHKTENYHGYDFDVRRVVTLIDAVRKKKKIEISVYPHDSSDRIVYFVTIITDVETGAGAFSGEYKTMKEQYRLPCGGLEYTVWPFPTFWEEINIRPYNYDSTLTKNIIVTGLILQTIFLEIYELKITDYYNSVTYYDFKSGDGIPPITIANRYDPFQINLTTHQTITPVAMDYMTFGSTLTFIPRQWGMKIRIYGKSAEGALPTISTASVKVQAVFSDGSVSDRYCWNAPVQPNAVELPKSIEYVPNQ